MAQRPHVPKFGNWDANDHMPYTVVFAKARNGRGKPVNPNDPTDNPDLSDGSRHNGGKRMYNVNDPEDVDASDMHQDRPGFGGGGRDAGNFRGQPPRTGLDAQGRRPGAAEGRGNPMPPSRAPPQVDFTRRPGNRESLGDRNLTDSPSTSFSADQSPAHPAGNPVKKYGTAGVVGGASPAWEQSRRNSKGEEAPSFAPATPTRGRGRPGNYKSEESAQKGPAALPKFGTWNAQDPSSGDGFTVIFNQARKERKAGGPGRIPQPGDHQQEQDLYVNNRVSNSNKLLQVNRVMMHREWFTPLAGRSVQPVYLL
ncbi:hypothetical protein R1sor_016894 [Riccia sorocarpa]|uniref:RIN4 pathogenic type III effector avirulence factor Avr cleavage site domain-containing protein n=1 Tax=Riccia sorocarpa TaxID=122646 RepID=A0ABD3HG74_9MARC